LLRSLIIFKERYRCVVHDFGFPWALLLLLFRLLLLLLLCLLLCLLLRLLLRLLLCLLLLCLLLLLLLLLWWLRRLLLTFSWGMISEARVIVLIITTTKQTLEPRART
jgi:hypothetical protein